MDKLLERLQKEAGLTEEQSVKVIEILKDFMDKEGIDWGNFFKGKYDELSDKAKSLFDKISGKAEDLVDKAKHEAKDLSDKMF